MAKIITFGEIMMRLQPCANDRIVQAKNYEATFGGGEANVAVCLSGLGHNTALVSGMPTNNIGKACLCELRKWGVNTDFIVEKEGRLGIYFCEKGYSCRPSVVIYDRLDSVFSNLSIGDIDWDKVFEDADWFHFTGITPAIGVNIIEILKIALMTAKKKGIKISCDLNYRKKLWKREEAQRTMTELMPYVDLLIANEEDCYDVFGIQSNNSDIDSGKICVEDYKSICSQLAERFNLDNIAITLRESISANINRWSAVLYSENRYYISKKYELTVLDRVGGGDAFGAGLINAYLNNMQLQDRIEYAVCCSALKHTVNGDFNLISDSEVLYLMNNGGNGRVQR